MGPQGPQTLRSEADILTRSSRPQRSSTFVPKTRDWRYVTGVIQHDDYEDAPKSRSMWDALDCNHQTSLNQRGLGRGSSRSRNGISSEMSVAEATEAVRAPDDADSRGVTESPAVLAQSRGPYKPIEYHTKVWRQITKFTRSEDTLNGDEADYDITGLVVQFRFTRMYKAFVKVILERPISSPLHSGSLDFIHPPNADQNLTPGISSPNTPATTRNAETVLVPHILDSHESLHTFPLFRRTWVDETYDFNAKAVRATLRLADTVVRNLGVHYEWYDNAVSADALFPPGVPLSAKEIQAFYPHHVRWKGVMVRLTNNGYRGGDIMGMQAFSRGPPHHHTPPVYMNNNQRDTVKSVLPGFKTATYKGKSDRNLRVDHITPGPHIEQTRKGFTLPTFDDLVLGLQRLPLGLDARALTQCLSWYLNMRNSFTPKLDLNVLHTQSLIRALRQPLKPFGPQYLDRNALQEWRCKGTFEATAIENQQQDHKGTAATLTSQYRTQMNLNFNKEEVSMNLTLPIRHILTFPFLALHGVVAEAFKMGIERAKSRKTAGSSREAKAVIKSRRIVKSVEKGRDEGADKEQDDDPELDGVPNEPLPEEPKKCYIISKRPRPEKEELLPTSKRLNMTTCSSVPVGPRQLATSPSRLYTPSCSQTPSRLGFPRNALVSSYGDVLSQSGQDYLCDQRDLVPQQAEPHLSTGRQNGRSIIPDTAHYQDDQPASRFGNGYHGYAHGG